MVVLYNPPSHALSITSAAGPAVLVTIRRARDHGTAVEGGAEITDEGIEVFEVVTTCIKTQRQDGQMTTLPPSGYATVLVQSPLQSVRSTLSPYYVVGSSHLRVSPSFSS